MDNQDRLINMLTKMDAFYFEYSEEVGISWITGKTITTNAERFVPTFRINPETSQDLFNQIINLASSIEGRTICLDARLLTPGIVEMLKEAYKEDRIVGIRIINDGYSLTKEDFKKFDNPDFYGFLITVDKISEDVDAISSYLDIREQKSLCKIEHIRYTELANQGEYEHDNYNVHITKKLSKEEIHELAKIIKKFSYQNIYVDFYDPPYYKELLDYLSMEHIPKDITITFLGNPLYDEKSCYENLQGIIPNRIEIHYNTCHDLNEDYRKEPFTEGVRYYSDIEASGFTDSSNYFEMIKSFDEIVEHMDRKKYSPLEKIAYLQDYFKKNFIYDPDYLTTDHEDNSRLDKIYFKDRMICEGFSNLYSALLRRANIPCFTYGTDDHQKNIVRLVDEKYGIERLAIIDPTFDLSTNNNRNVFKNFLIPIDSDLYAYAEDGLGRDVQTPSVIDIPTSLIMSSEYYNTLISESNPVYATNPLGYAIRMLQLMGLSNPDIPMNEVERQEFYKSALARSTLTGTIPTEQITTAIHYVREQEHDYGDEYESQRDKEDIERNVRERGFKHIFDPKVKMFDKPDANVELYNPTLDVHFQNIAPQAIKYHRPRKRQENESLEEYNKYLKKFYEETFYGTRKEEKDNMNEYTMGKEGADKLEKGKAPIKHEFVVKKRNVIVIYRDKDDWGRTFVTKEVLDRFHLPLPPFKIQLPDDKFIYEINPRQATYIIDNAKNSYSPYTVEYQSFDFDNELRDEYANLSKRPQQKDGLPEIAIYRDVHDSGRAFVTEPVLKRFNLERTPFEVNLGEYSVYEISPVDAINIISNANNNYSPYQIKYVGIEFENPLEQKVGQQPVEPPVEEKKVNEQPVEVEEDEFIPGTNFKKPRPRGIYETDEEYVSYLEEYYTSIFGPTEESAEDLVNETEVMNVAPPRAPFKRETREEYEYYLNGYCQHVYGREKQEVMR